MDTYTPSTARADARPNMVRVWDPFVRIFHWSVVVAFFIAYFTDDDLLSLHVWAGYTIGGFLALRVIWGVVGPKHARFSDFIYSPATVLKYVVELITFRSKRYIGHSPAGGAMVIALLIGLAATVWSGLELYAAEDGKGPLAGAPHVIAPAVAATRPAGGRILLADRDEDERDDEEDERKGRGENEDLWEDLHEALANLTFILVILHLGGVALASIVHRENLPRSMVTGLKRAED